MAFNDLFRLSSHAVITNSDGQVLLLHADYGDCSWGLPGGALEPGETIHAALMRECNQELNEVKQQHEKLLTDDSDENIFSSNR